MNIRPYAPSDYFALKALYEDSSTYGGQFDEARDAENRLAAKIDNDPESIWVAENDGKLAGSVSLIEDGRVAWLFRFAVIDQDLDVSKSLYDKATAILKSRGHDEVLVYSPVDNAPLDNRYQHLGLNKGADYTCYWQGI